MLAVLLAVLAFIAEPADWEKAESAHLQNIKQVTRDFVRAGEGYFSPDGKTIIFQAEEKDTGNPFYQIFTMDLATGRVRRVSPGVGKTTCSFFRPDGKKIIFASSHLDPDAKKQYAEEYQQREDDKQGRHAPPLPVGLRSVHGASSRPTPTAPDLKRLTDAKGYNAEGSYSPDGKQIVFCSNRGGRQPGTVHHGRRRQERPPADARPAAATTAARSSRPTASASSSAATARRRTTCSCTSSTPTAPASGR